MLFRAGVVAISMTLTLVAVGCASPPETVEVEVTREVPVTQEVPVTVPVTVETVRTVTATREVPVTQEVPVTVVVPQTVEVTREVLVPQTVEVTPQAPVTRSAAVSPTPAVTPTASPVDTPTATPPPAMTPMASSTPTPGPAAPEATRFGSWTLDEQQHHEGFEIHRFQNEALEQTGVQPPTLTYQCDTRGGRTMYINWRGPITAGSSDRPSASRDPFSQYRDIPYYALLEYAGGLLEFVDDLRLTPQRTG